MAAEVIEGHRPKHVTIQIDRVHYEVDEFHLTGEQLRQIPTPPIGPDRDLFEVVPGHSDHKISDTENVDLRDGTRFFTAPAHINPGRSGL
jgi:hypothetical protein